MKCECGENAFFYKKTSIEENYIITTEVYKCGRNIENTKKTKCSFNFQKELSKIKLDTDICSVSAKKCIIKKEKFIDYKPTIYKMLEFYNAKITNFFGRLNYYLQKYNIPVHDPKIETYKELKKRIDEYFIHRIIIKLKEKKISKIDTILDNYTPEEAKSESIIYEYNKSNIDYFDEFRLKFKEGVYPFNIKNIPLKNKRKNTNKKNNKNSLFALHTKEFANDDDEEEEDKNINKNEIDSESESESESDNENLEDNKFDVDENDSDIGDDTVVDYDDFSD